MLPSSMKSSLTITFDFCRRTPSSTPLLLRSSSKRTLITWRNNHIQFKPHEALVKIILFSSCLQNILYILMEIKEFISPPCFLLTNSGYSFIPNKRPQVGIIRTQMENNRSMCHISTSWVMISGPTQISGHCHLKFMVVFQWTIIKCEQYGINFFLSFVSLFTLSWKLHMLFASKLTKWIPYM